MERSDHMRLAVVLGVSVVMSGCARSTTVLRKYNGDGSAPSSIAIDAKQRVVLASRQQTTAWVPSKDFTSDGPVPAEIVATVSRDPVYCAEPSPDALSALSASSGLSLSKKDQLTAAANTALAEAAGSIGLRTQTIQLMRDAMYRLCEGYMDGALDAAAFETLQRRFQSTMVAIVAVEQLTGVARPPAIMLGGDATAGNAELVARYTQKTEESRALVKTAETSVANAEAKHDSDAAKLQLLVDEKKGIPTDESKRSEDQKKRLPTLDVEIKKAQDAEKESLGALTAAKEILDNRQAEFKSWDSARIAALGGGGTAKTTFQVEQIGSGSKPSDDSAAAVARAVQQIVSDTLALGFGRELCTTLMLDSPSLAVAQNETSVLHGCMEYLDASTRYVTKSASLLEKQLDNEQKRLALLEAALAKAPSDTAVIAGIVKQIQDSKTDPVKPPFMTR